MGLWRNAKIRTKIGAGLLVALIGVAAFAGALVIDKQRQAAASAEVKRLTTFSVSAGNLLHETQRERGRTAQFTSAKGAKFGPELKAQQQATDQRLAEYRRVVDAHAAEASAAVRAALDTVRSAVGRISTLRAEAAGLATPPAQIIGGYTDLNQTLLKMIAITVGQNRNPSIAARLQAYLALLSAKESAGLERAQLTNVFTMDRFAAGQFTTVVSLIAAQQAYLTVFERAASADVLARWAQTRTSSVFDQVAGYEKIAIDRAATGGFAVDPAVWFNAATNKIDMYKTLEDYQASGVLAAATAGERSARRTAWAVLVTAALLLLLTIGIATAVILSIIRPLREVTEVAEQMAAGDVSREVTYRSGDEMGHLAHSFRELAGYIRECATLADALAQGDLRHPVRPRGDRDLLGNAMNETVRRLGTIVSEIKRSGRQLSSSAMQLTEANSALVANSEETAHKAQSVSTASEEMIASIADISRSTSEAAGVARSAVATADDASRVIAQLGDASGEIGGVVELIQAIASQTNLLALNATIEAARAGETGKGFAVVAEEVKRLAQQTAEATDTITQRVSSIEDGASAAGRAVAQIGEVVGRINEIASTIAGAVEEQTVTTSEISRSVEAVAGAAGATSAITNQSAESARALSAMAQTLQDLVAQFAVDDRDPLLAPTA